MRCSCDTHRAGYDRHYVSRVDRDWPRWLAFLVGPPGSKDYAAAKEFVGEYERAEAEGRVGVGLLGSVICADSETARQITSSFGTRLPS